MTTDKVREYYQSTLQSEARADFKFALSQVQTGKTAIDCGCGAGSNIKHLRNEGYAVYAFDIDAESIALCKRQFADDPHVFLTQASFGSFDYPTAALVIADASLFFCPTNELEITIAKIEKSLLPQGIFYGSFLGEKDTMADENYNHEDYWGDVLVLTEIQIKHLLKHFEFLKWTEFEQDGLTPSGELHHWHIFSVVAKLKTSFEQ